MLAGVWSSWCERATGVLRHDASNDQHKPEFLDERLVDPHGWDRRLVADTGINTQRGKAVTMNPIGKNVLAVVGGIVVGSVVNMALVNIGPAVIPLPEGADISTMEGLRDSMKLFAPANFIAPFLAHALGTLVGAFMAARFAASHPRKLAMFVGVFFLIGGIAAVSMFGGPMWFKVTDLLLAYLPMGFLGGKLAAWSRSEAA